MNMTGPIDGAKIGEGNVKERVEVFYNPQQRLEDMQHEVDEMSTLKEEIEELRRFEEWSEPQLSGICELRKQVSKQGGCMAELDSNVCDLKEECSTYAQFKEPAETQIRELEEFRTESELQLKDMVTDYEVRKWRKNGKIDVMSMKWHVSVSTYGEI